MRHCEGEVRLGVRCPLAKAPLRCREGSTLLAEVDDRDAMGRMTELTLLDGVEAALSWDQRGRPTGLTVDVPGVGVQARSYHWDARGRLEERVIDGAGTVYGYAEPGWLTEETGPGGTTLYEYDAAGNRVSTDDGTTVTDFDYATGNLLSAVDSVALTWDGLGGVVEDQRGYAFERSPDGRAWGIREPGGDLVVELLRDAEGLPVRRYPESGPSSTRVWGNPMGAWPLAGDDGGERRMWVGLDGLLVARLEGSSDEVAAMSDPLTGTLVLLDDELLDGASAWGTAVDAPVGRTEGFVFAGMETLPGTPHKLAGHRLYDPDTGRFMSADPLGLDGGPHRFGYAEGEPTRLVDPVGLSAVGVMSTGVPSFSAFGGWSAASGRTEDAPCQEECSPDDGDDGDDGDGEPGESEGDDEGGDSDTDDENKEEDGRGGPVPIVTGGDSPPSTDETTDAVHDATSSRDATDYLKFAYLLRKARSALENLAPKTGLNGFEETLQPAMRPLLVQFTPPHRSAAYALYQLRYGDTTDKEEGRENLSQHAMDVYEMASDLTGTCFTDDAMLPTPAGPQPIADAAPGDRVLTGLSTPVRTCSRLRRTCVAAVGALLAACTTAPVDPPGAGEEVLAYEPRSGAWVEVLAAEVPDGAELLHQGQLFEQTATGPEWLGAPDPESLHLADAAFSEVDCHPEPLPEDWVLVLDPARHAPLAEVDEGETVAFAGRLFEVQGEEVVPTGDAVGRVVEDMQHRAPTVIEARILGPAGEDVLYVTPEHPFWVPMRQGFRTIGSIPVGTRLHVQGGGEALLVGKTWRYGDVEVFNVEVEGLHSYYVHGPGGGDGVWVHNRKGPAAAVREGIEYGLEQATKEAGENAVERTAKDAAGEVASRGVGAASRPVRNAHLAGKTHPVTGIPFDDAGFPDFSSVSKADVKITYTGNRAGDFKAANEAAGLGGTPRGYTWHHHQDGTTMQLVPMDVHSKTGHTGGFTLGGE